MPRDKKRMVTPLELARAEIDAVITMAQALNGWNREELARQLGFTAPTLIKRRKEVYSWQIGELKKLAIFARKDLSEIFGKVENI